jgi:hypothetical protein
MTHTAEPPSAFPSTTMASSYTQAPPTYQPAAPYKDDPNANPTSPLLGNASLAAGSSRQGAGAIYDMPEAGDLPDDFKVTKDLWHC